MPRRRSLRVRVLAAMATYTLALKACWFTPITRSPAQKSACKDLGRNGQSPAITPKATYTPISNRDGSHSLKKVFAMLKSNNSLSISALIEQHGHEKIRQARRMLVVNLIVYTVIAAIELWFGAKDHAVALTADGQII